jgi:predicted double-glycine peptidase
LQVFFKTEQISELMDDLQRDNVILDVPYFQQTRTATCGPACLMMVMKYWDPSFELSRSIEFQLWLKSFSFFLFGGTFQFGLATAAVGQGFKTEVYQKEHFSAYYSKFPRIVDLIEHIVSRGARKTHIPIQYGANVVDVIDASLLRRIPPIVFVNLKPILGENVFHWVVVTGKDKTTVYFNDPYVPIGFPMSRKKNYPLSLEIFQKAIATETGRHLRLPPCVVLVYKDI